MVPDFIEHGLRFALIGGVLGGIGYLSARAKPSGTPGAVSDIGISRWMIFPMAVIGFGIGGLAVWSALFARGGTAAVVVGIGMLAIGYYFAQFLSSAYRVRWTKDAITGPTSYGIWPFGPSCGTIAFADIEDFGMDWAQAWFVQDAAGQRIRWSQFHSGYPHLMMAIEAARPDLFPPDEAQIV